MPETLYVPDPRVSPLVFPPSRGLGSGGGGSIDEDDIAAALGSEFINSDFLAVEFFDDYAAGAITTFDKGSGFIDSGVGTGCSVVAGTMASGSVHQRLEISAGQYGRKMPWGNDWGRIQIAVLWRINHGVTFTSNLAYFGVCSGTTNMAASATTTNFTGLITPADASAATFTAGTRVSYFAVSPTWRFASRRVTTTTDRTSGSGSAGTAMSASAGYLSAHFLEISRATFVGSSSVNYNFGRRMTDTTRAEDSLEKTSLIDMLRSDIVSALASGNTNGVVMGGSPNTLTYAFDESTGELDTINITWPEVFGLQLGAIGVRKVY